MNAQERLMAVNKQFVDRHCVYPKEMWLSVPKLGLILFSRDSEPQRLVDLGLEELTVEQLKQLDEFIEGEQR